MNICQVWYNTLKSTNPDESDAKNINWTIILSSKNLDNTGVFAVYGNACVTLGIKTVNLEFARVSRRRLSKKPRRLIRTPIWSLIPNWNRQGKWRG